jgi:glycosyltransferase involved in cell wall biosynthesis
MGKTIKVLQISSYPPPRAGWGMRIFFLKKEMEKQGHICTVLNIGKSRLLKGRDFETVLSGFDYVKKIFRYRFKGYLVHMHLNGDSPKGFVLTTTALILSAITFKRPVITFHAGPVQIYFPQQKAPLLTPLYKFIFTVPKYIICNNQAVKDNIISYGVDPQKIFTIPAFSRQYLQFNQKTLKAEIENFFERHEPVICSYVFFRAVFFIEYMISAMAELKKRWPKFGLIIMGSDEDSENIKELIDQLNLTKNIMIAGDQDHDSFLTIVGRSKLYLRTHIKDGVCSSILEALSIGTPVVACEDGIRPKSVVTYQNKNVQDMVQKISYVIENHEKVKNSISKPEIRDTTVDEINLLARAFHS